jgi:hypothetical protein
MSILMFYFKRFLEAIAEVFHLVSVAVVVVEEGDILEVFHLVLVNKKKNNVPIIEMNIKMIKLKKLYI